MFRSYLPNGGTNGIGLQSQDDISLGWFLDRETPKIGIVIRLLFAIEKIQAIFESQL